MKFEINYPTQLPVQEAKARLQALGDYLWKKHKIGVTWNGDDAHIKGRYLVVSIDGVVQVREGQVSFEGKDPGMLWRTKAKEYLTYKLKTYLDPKTPFDSLPKA